MWHVCVLFDKYSKSTKPLLLWCFQRMKSSCMDEAMILIRNTRLMNVIQEVTKISMWWDVFIIQVQAITGR